MLVNKVSGDELTRKNVNSSSRSLVCCKYTAFPSFSSWLSLVYALFRSVPFRMLSLDNQPDTHSKNKVQNLYICIHFSLLLFVGFTDNHYLYGIIITKKIRK